MRPELEALGLAMILERVESGEPICREDRLWAIDRLSRILASADPDEAVSDQAESYLRRLEP